MYVDENGNVKWGTPLYRLEGAIAGQTLKVVPVLAGDVEDTCNTLDQDEKLVVALKGQVAQHIDEGNATMAVRVKLEDIKQLIVLCKKAAAEEFADEPADPAPKRGRRRSPPQKRERGDESGE